ncbi:hypothetical protein [Myxococcus sp. RHSTA-1-4]|uniref:hypothetical protein n=1 Tax=Myxococcus sp. RHSTA-1-4 TaxID=2874601 RepID=UPI001CBDE6DF|nr:hypothetical protein [Myxococcus sp. RHSTA-1-4]
MSHAFKGIQASGSSVYSVVAAIKSFSVLVNELMQDLKVQTRDERGVLVLDTNAWYDLELYLPVYKRIDTLLGGRGLEKVGSFVPQNAVFPPHVKDVQSALASIDIAYHMNHRKDGRDMFNPATGEMMEGIGHYTYQPVAGKNEAVMVCDNPYPCRFDMGLIKGMAQRFQPQATLTHDAHQGCRHKGAASCTYVITW